MLKKLLTLLAGRRRRIPRSAGRLDSGLNFEPLETRTLLTALPLSGFAPEREPDHGEPLTHAERPPAQHVFAANSFVDRQHDPVRANDHDRGRSGHQAMEPRRDLFFTFNVVPIGRFDPFVVTPRDGGFTTFVVLPPTSTGGAASLTPDFAGSVGVNPAPAIETISASDRQSAAPPVAAGDSGPSSILTGINMGVTEPALPEPRAELPAAWERLLDFVLQSEAGAPSASSDLVSTSWKSFTTDVAGGPADVFSEPDTPSKSLEPGISDAPIWYGHWAATAISSLDSFRIESFAFPGVGDFTNMQGDVALAINAWWTARLVTADQTTGNDSTEMPASDRGIFIDIAELFGDRFDESLDGRVPHDQQQEERPDDELEQPISDAVFAGEACDSPYRMLAKLARSVIAPTEKTAADQTNESPPAVPPADGGMIAIAYDRAHADESHTGTAPAATDSPRAGRSERIDYVRADGTSARYQAFELAAPANQEASEDQGLAKDAPGVTPPASTPSRSKLASA